MVAVVGVSRGHYEEIRTRYAKSYVWRPEHVTVECECGERLEFTSVEGAVCGCGRDHGSAVGEELGSLAARDRDPELPWRPEIDQWKGRSEQDYKDELAEVDRVREE